MKRILLLFMLLPAMHGLFAQNVGIGTASPVARLDILGGNNWNLSGGEGDVRIGNGSFRLKFGVALDGGGAGAANIMQFGQPGGFNVLSLGAQGNQILFVNGGSNAVGIGTASPTTKLEVVGTTSTSNLTLTGMGNGNPNDFLIKTNAAGAVGAKKGHGAQALNYIICTGGLFVGPQSTNNLDSSWIGEVKLFAGSFAPPGWAFCHGQILNIVSNTALFAILGTTYGGNGQTTFALPDLRGAAPVSFGTPAGGGNTWDLGERTQ
jgi:microcystin-dependent protein